MVQGYYTLDEAARMLGMATEELSLMAQRREVRAFADRGTWRFRTQDIEELVRRRGPGSNPDLPLGEAPRPKPHDTPTARESPQPVDEGVFNFGLGTETDQVDLGQDLPSEVSGSSAISGTKTGSKSSNKNLGPKTPPPKPGSDSDVRLVPDGSNVVFEVSGDSGIKVVDESGSSSSSGKRKVAGVQGDSGVKLVPMDPGQSDVRLVSESPADSAVLGGSPPKTASDSDVRLESPSPLPVKKGGPRRGEKAPEDSSFLTEEIDLDAELRKAEEAGQAKKPKVKAPPQAKQPPAATPFELSEADLDLPTRPEPAAGKKVTDSSSDFDLSIPAEEDLSSVQVDSDELRPSKEEEVPLGELPAGVASDSGIHLEKPADSGISLEQSGDSSDEIEFELRQGAAASQAPPKPAEPAAEDDSSGDFELTLEDSGRLAPLEDDAAHAAAEGEKDIFETDFEVPALEDESGSQALALDESDTDLESSDFDLALGEGDMAADEESGSQVVALDDEEEVDEGAATVARPTRRGGAAVAEDKGADFIAGEELEEEEVAPSRRAAAVAAAPADWGVFTPVVLLFSFFVLFLLGLMSFELMHGMWGYHQPTKVASPVVRLVGSLFYGPDFPTD